MRLSKHNTGANKEGGGGGFFFISDFLINVVPNQMLPGLLCTVTTFSVLKNTRASK